MTIQEGDTIKLHPKTGKGKQVVHRDGSLFKVVSFEESVLFSEDKDWINLDSVNNPKNGRWIQQFHDKNFDWEIIR
jgi:ribosomal protein L24E